MGTRNRASTCAVAGQVLTCYPSTRSRAAAGRDSSTFLAYEEISRPKDARQLGAVHSLAICLLHQTPISVSRVARLAITDFAEDPQGRSFATLGNTLTTQTPWRIGQQAREAVDALKDDQSRLISPHTSTSANCSGS